MDKRYYLDLLTVVESVGQRNATLLTQLPRGVQGLAGPCRGTVHVVMGQIAECVIEGRNGGRVEGKQAFQVLSSVTEWSVRLEQNREERPAEPYVPPTKVPMEEGGLREPAPSIPLQAVPLPPVPYGGHDQGWQPIPHQVRPINMAMLDRLKPKERLNLRMVLAMVNGQRSVEQIKEQLRLAPETVDQLLALLRQMGVIE